MTKKLIEKTAEYVKMKLFNEPTGHDWYHVKRVLNIARFLQEKEGGDLEIIELTALLQRLSLKYIGSSKIMHLYPNLIQDHQ